MGISRLYLLAIYTYGAPALLKKFSSLDVMDSEDKQNGNLTLKNSPVTVVFVYQDADKIYKIFQGLNLNTTSIDHLFGTQNHEEKSSGEMKETDVKSLNSQLQTLIYRFKLK